MAKRKRRQSRKTIMSNPATRRRQLADQPDTVFELEIKLIDSSPAIWRRFLVPCNITLARLHDVFQVVMGWTDDHLHQFFARGACYGRPDPTWEGDGTLDERHTKLSEVMEEPGDTIWYEYDFGDGWEHEIELLSVAPADEQDRYPLCTAGERRCPPEDSGGIHFFQGRLMSLADARDKGLELDEEDLWMDPEWDPERFSVDAVNARLRAWFRPR